MKRNYVSYLMLVLVFLMAVVASCEKEGPAGPAGKDGVDGVAGEDGIDGTDGTATCIQCHDDSQVNFAKTLQWEASVHATGGNFERNAVDCAPCHVSQGFLERMAAGTMETAAAINNPNPPNCYTCHEIHSTYETSDWAITYNDAVTLWHPADGTLDVGTGNLCANCHQARIPNPMPVPGGGNVTITSPYWGAHHGPVANITAGMGGYEVEGSLNYSNSFHTTNVENGCTTCHMATAYGVQAGGHSMGMTYAYHGHDVINTAGCVSCHSDAAALETKIEETKTEMVALFTELGTLLVTQGVMDEEFHAIPGEMTADQAGGVLNFNMAREDKSSGIHNYLYTKALLTNSIESLQ